MPHTISFRLDQSHQGAVAEGFQTRSVEVTTRPRVRFIAAFGA
jgi:hypothetical protein